MLARAPGRRLRRPLLALASLCVVAPLRLSAQTGRAALVGALDSIARAALADHRAAGLSVGVVKGRDTLLLRGYGFADLEFDVPTPDRAIYEIGSVTKQFTASAILQLVEQGKLSLDDDLVKYLPDYPEQGHAIPIRRLMDHTSGIKGYTEMPGFGAISVRKLPRDSLVAMFSKAPFDFAPGERMVYNNSAYFLLGLIIEKVSGKPYADYVRENLFARAGMADSRYCSENEVVKRRAHGYDTGPGGVLVRAAYLDHTWPFAAGSLCSTAGDLIAWTRALHGGAILGPAAYRELIAPGALADGTPLRYAKGLALSPVAGHRAIHHGGGINGFLSELDYFPDDTAIVVVLVNSTGPVNPGGIATALAARLLGRREPPAGPPFTGDLAALAGTWRGVGRGNPLTVEIVADSTGLRVRSRGGQFRPLRYIGGDTFEGAEDRYTFLREGGRAVRLRYDGVAMVTTLERQP
jgi:CubicO group peptidase (beta-lactamase class C family)